MPRTKSETETKKCLRTSVLTKYYLKRVNDFNDRGRIVTKQQLGVFEGLAALVRKFQCLVRQQSKVFSVTQLVHSCTVNIAKCVVCVKNNCMQLRQDHIYNPNPENCMCITYDSPTGYEAERPKQPAELEESLLDSSLTAREIVLQQCGQTEPRPFNQCYPDELLKNCQKIGEGVYGEVFLFRDRNGGTTVAKIIPIEGLQLVNGQRQTRFREVLTETLITKELSDLRNNKKNKTNGFIELKNVKCVKGRYPERLIELWELYDETKGSQNDSPEMFDDDQLFISLELAYGGKDLESFQFEDAQQSYSMIQQVTCALAVAEEQYKFEHRDLHWGNILIAPTTESTLSFNVNGLEFMIESRGIQISIIDFTLSRFEVNGVVVYNELESDLFEYDGDLQFQTYKLMQDRNGNDWKSFEPYNNILWLRYLLIKASSQLHYSSINSDIHYEYLLKMRDLADSILKYSSAEDFVQNCF